MKTITLPAGTLHFQIDELAHHMALSLYPLRDDDSPGDGLSYAFCCETLKAELTQAVESKELPVRDPLTFGPHAHPYGASVQHALVRVDDLRKYVADRGLLVEVHESEVPAQSLAMAEPVAVVEVPPNKPLLPPTRTRVVDALTGLIEDAELEIGASANVASINTMLFQWAIGNKKPGRLLENTSDDILRFMDGRHQETITESALKQRIRRYLNHQGS